MEKTGEEKKIYTKIVIDMKSGKTIAEESFKYAGPMALCDGDGDGGAGDPPEWTASLPPDIQGWDEVKNSDSSEKFWGQMVNMRSRMGQSVTIPSDDAGEEDRAAFYAKIKEKVPGLMISPDFENEETLTDLYGRMGRPTEAKDYKVPEFKDSKGQDIPGLDLTMAETLKESAFKAGVSQKKFTEMISALVTPTIAKYEETLSAAQASKDELATEWGTAFERNSKIVNTFLSLTDAPESIVKAAAAGGLGKTAMTWIHKMATQTLQGDTNLQNDINNRGVMTPDEATTRISEIRNNKKHPYNNKQDPGHKAAMKTVRELYLLKDPKNGKSAAPGTQFGVGGLGKEE